MRLTTAVLAGTIAAAGLFAPAPAGATALQIGRTDDAVVRAFQAVLRRNPSERELRRYSTLAELNGWNETDIRRDLEERSDYWRSSNRNWRPEAAIRDAYQDVLGRDPDPEGLRHYRDRIRLEGWTEQDVREALRKSDEYRAEGFRTASADRIVRRAYQDVLHREPDPEGLASYRRQVLENGWEYQDVRRALARSPERRDVRRAVREADAAEMVRRAYLTVLNREPDPTGLRDYTDKVRRDGWTEEQLVRALRDSEEYRSKHH
jgi:hypothetical protein